MEGPSDTVDRVDVGRLEKPDADAFRYIADQLGARFAGDREAVDETSAPYAICTSRYSVERTAAEGSTHAIALADPKRAKLLDRVPVPLVVVDEDAIAFVNKAALGILGYGSAALLDAAGGLGALFGSQADRPCPFDGAMLVRTAAGAAFAARVEMSSIDWGFGGALLLSIIPCENAGRSSAATRKLMAGDPLGALLNANPDPVVLLSRSGAVEACNSAFVSLGPSDRDVIRIDERLGPADARHLMDTVTLSFAVEDGIAETAWPLEANGAAYWVSVGALGQGQLACAVFHRYERSATESGGSNSRFVGLAQAAVLDVRRLIGDAAVLLVHRASGHPRPLEPKDRLAVEFLRSVLLSAASRVPVGTVLTLESAADGLTLSSSVTCSASGTIFEPLVASARINALAATAGLSFDVNAAVVRVTDAVPGEVERRRTSC